MQRVYRGGVLIILQYRSHEIVDISFLQDRVGLRRIFAAPGSRSITTRDEPRCEMSRDVFGESHEG